MRLSEFTQPLRKGRRKPNGLNEDLGFGTKIAAGGERLINRDGSLNVIRRGKRPFAPYLALVEMSWGRFFGVIFLIYVCVNAFFAGLYLLAGPESLIGLGSDAGVLDRFTHAFFFSIQTFTTVGYGSISPHGFWGNIISAMDALVGLMAFALATGLFFARFARPRAQLRFSQNAVIAPYTHPETGEQMQSLQFRVVNPRNNKIINLSARVIVTWFDQGVRKYAALELERTQVFMLPLNWTLVHPISNTSPLKGLRESDLLRDKAEILILIQGYDDTFAQDVHANCSYTCKEVVWDRKFKPMYHSLEGVTVLELDKLNEMEKV